MKERKTQPSGEGKRELGEVGTRKKKRGPDARTSRGSKKETTIKSIKTKDHLKGKTRWDSEHMKRDRSRCKKTRL